MLVGHLYEPSKLGCLLSEAEEVDRCRLWSNRGSAHGETARLSEPLGDDIEMESRLGVFGPPIRESKFLSYAWEELSNDLCSSCRSLFSLRKSRSVADVSS